MADSNHPGLHEPWMRDYDIELRRTAGYGCRFAACGGGWYALHTDNPQSGLRPRVRRSSVLEMTQRLKERPDLRRDAK